MRTSKIRLIFFVVAMLLFSAAGVRAQSPPPTNGAPLDTGAGVLVLVAAAYGYFRIKKEESVMGTDRKNKS